MKYKRTTAVVAMIVNLIFAVLAIRLIINYHKIETMGLSADLRLKYGEEYLRLLCYQVIPGCIIVMSASALLFWFFRK